MRRLIRCLTQPLIRTVIHDDRQKRGRTCNGNCSWLLTLYCGCRSLQPVTSQRSIDGTIARRRTCLELAPDITGNRQHDHFSHQNSPVIQFLKPIAENRKQACQATPANSQATLMHLAWQALSIRLVCCGLVRICNQYRVTINCRAPSCLKLRPGRLRLVRFHLHQLGMVAGLTAGTDDRAHALADLMLRNIDTPLSK